jgi:hypothetical protein
VVKGKRAGIYLRVSTEEQNTALQETELTESAERRGWEFKMYQDLGISGTKENRPGLGAGYADMQRSYARLGTNIASKPRANAFPRPAPPFAPARSQRRVLAGSSGALGLSCGPAYSRVPGASLRPQAETGTA